ncbi:hypothetical protein D9M72_615050 [compost metagenome]
MQHELRNFSDQRPVLCVVVGGRRSRIDFEVIEQLREGLVFLVETTERGVSDPLSRCTGLRGQEFIGVFVVLCGVCWPALAQLGGQHRRSDRSTQRARKCRSEQSVRESSGVAFSLVPELDWAIVFE